MVKEFVCSQMGRCTREDGLVFVGWRGGSVSYFHISFLELCHELDVDNAFFVSQFANLTYLLSVFNEGYSLHEIIKKFYRSFLRFGGKSLGSDSLCTEIARYGLYVHVLHKPLWVL